MKSIGFKATILASVAVLITICLMASNWLSYVTLKKDTIQNVDKMSRSLVNYEAQKIETWFHDKVQVIDSLANHYQSQKAAASYIERAALSEDMSGFSLVMYGIDDGRSFTSSGPRDPKKYDPRTRTWYKKAQAARGIALTDVYNDAVTGKAVISMSKKVANGVILGDIELGILDQVVDEIRFPSAVTLILDDSGRALASNSTEFAVGKRLADVGMQAVQQSMLSQDTSDLHYELNGVKKLSFTKVIELIEGKKWYLFYH